MARPMAVCTATHVVQLDGSAYGSTLVYTPVLQNEHAMRQKGAGSLPRKKTRKPQLAREEQLSENEV